MYKIISLLIKIYSFTVSHSFHSFGKKSLVKPFLNVANPQYISVGKKVNIGSFGRMVVSTSFGGKICQSKNKVRIHIKNHVDVGHNVFISANNYVEIGNNVIMAPYVFITDHDHGFYQTDLNLHDQPLTEGGKTIIKDNVFLGTKCSIMKNVTIGKHSVVAANSVVTKNVPAFSVVAGIPAKVIKKINPSK